MRKTCFYSSVSLRTFRHLAVPAMSRVCLTKQGTDIGEGPILTMTPFIFFTSLLKLDEPKNFISLYIIF